MQINSINNNTSFKGITPIRVYKDGIEVSDNQVIRNTCSKVIKAFSGPLENKYKSAAAQLAVRDSDYCYPLALRGYADKFTKADAVPSDYIKVIYDKSDKGYLVTGQLSEVLGALGYKIGVAMKECKENGTKTSHQLEAAKSEYWAYVKLIGNSAKYRTREAFNKATGAKLGEMQEIRVDITTKPVKIKGKTTQKVKIENISFNDRHITA